MLSRRTFVVGDDVAALACGTGDVCDASTSREARCTRPQTRRSQARRSQGLVLRTYGRAGRTACDPVTIRRLLVGRLAHVVLVRRRTRIAAAARAEVVAGPLD